MKENYLKNLSKVKQVYMDNSGFPVYEFADGRIFAAGIGSSGVYWYEIK